MRGTLIRRRTFTVRGGARWFRLAAVGVLAVALLPATASGEDGNIGSNEIEVLDDANLYPHPATRCIDDALNPTPDANGFDWVKDCLANPELTPGTDAAAAKGHWNGFRVLDGIAGADQDIFLTGGKENDHETWNPGPGTVGSSKYDITQAYLANNNTHAFFGMERRGNNGTTAFDWEFNKYAPNPAGPFPLYVPNRSEGDVLITFEMQGAGNSGSATPFRFIYDDPDVADGTADPESDADFDGVYKPATVTGTIAAINHSDIPSAPWGAVTSRGDWATDPLDRFKFAEAKVPLSLLGIEQEDTCEDISRFVQVRTRASSTENSDLKDLTKIFSFDFFAPVNPTQALAELCDAVFSFDSSIDSGTAPDWKFEITNPTQVTLSGLNGLTLSGPTTVSGKSVWTATSKFSGQVQVNLPTGQDSVTIEVSQSLTDANDCDTGSSGSIVVHRALGVTASLTPDCGNVFDYSATASGGVGAKSFSWSFEKRTATNPDVWTPVATATSASGSIDMDTVTGGGQGTYRGVVAVTDEADASTGKPECTATATTNSVSVYDDLSATASIDPDCDSTFDWSAEISGGKAPYDIDVLVQKRIGTNPDQWSTVETVPFSNDADGDVEGSFDISADLDLVEPGVQAAGEGRYRIHVDASDDQAVPCTTDVTSSAADIREQLVATAVKQSADGAALSVSMNGGSNAPAADNPTFQWQYRIDNGSWNDLGSQTTEDFDYSTFETQDTSPAPTTFTIAAPNVASGDYAGKVWVVDLRLRVSRSLNGELCSDVSEPVTVKKLTAVDP